MASKTRNKLFYKNFPLKNRLGITTGDLNGVGQTITQKSLATLKPQKNFQFLVWTHKKSPSLKVPSFRIKTFQTSEQALKEPFSNKIILEIKSKNGAGDWVEEAGRLCLDRQLSALITGPVSKATMKKNKYRCVSQTPLLQALSGVKQVFMVFKGRFFNVILLQDHQPLKKVRVSPGRLRNLLNLALELRSWLEPKKSKKPLALLGLNPHAGEGGLIGKEEQKILKPLLKKHFSSKQVEGPLPPDSAFLKKNWNRYSFYLALYHDQGLIPFKALHNHTGFVFTLGLPFLRFSVDHGTGIHLKSRDISFESFLGAIQEALKTIKRFKRK